MVAGCNPSGGDRGFTRASPSLPATDMVLPPSLSSFKTAAPKRAPGRVLVASPGASPPAPFPAAPVVTDGDRSDKRPCTMRGSSSCRPSLAPRGPFPPGVSAAPAPMLPVGPHRAVGDAAAASSFPILFAVVRVGMWVIVSVQNVGPNE